ncbi:hypothetical protein [Colwellia sp. 20A7]|uniref:hypothetical protein n=1 Tax=Colwellia sp. 20A7 TaxID=2689569 RepID=UPI00135811F7|nr:hypothetical protein [Colwellia sp. 20A7]
MTMIIGINLDEYIIVAADRREVCMQDGKVASITSDEINKFVKWNGGIITGCGYVPLLSDLKSYLKTTEITNTNQIVALTKQSVSSLPSYANAWKNQTHWMFSYLAPGDESNECRLGYIKSGSPDEVRMLYPMTSTIWAKLPDIEQRLNYLNESLKPLSASNEFNDNLQYHLGLIDDLFAYASTVDQTVSREFDYYIQCHNGEESLSRQA